MTVMERPRQIIKCGDFALRRWRAHWSRTAHDNEWWTAKLAGEAAAAAERAPTAEHAVVPQQRTAERPAVSAPAERRASRAQTSPRLSRPRPPPTSPSPNSAAGKPA